MNIHDARPISGELSLDREGFVLVQHEIAALTERESPPFVSKYIEEMAAFIKAYLGASWVVPWVRAGELGEANVLLSAATLRSAAAGSKHTPAPLAHIDFSSKYAPAVAALANRAHGISRRAYSRMMLIQAWCALSPPPQDLPLAIADGRTVADTDLIEDWGDHPNRKSVSPGWVLRHSPTQVWYYFSNMKQDEFIIFKGYDSDESRNTKCAHTSFDNRRAFPNATPRESIETRFWVYFE
ncbi:hypothetical protein XI09_10045 [Bradyrhizobium sp. CCBAU 11386]|nr:hypothetical protein [Bradyrhizobium sp. CCBAU 11386]